MPVVTIALLAYAVATCRRQALAFKVVPGVGGSNGDDADAPAENTAPPATKVAKNSAAKK